MQFEIYLWRSDARFEDLTKLLIVVCDYSTSEVEEAVNRIKNDQIELVNASKSHNSENFIKSINSLGFNC